MTKKLLLIPAVLLFVVATGLSPGSANAYAAAKRIDCSKVMSQLQGGKKVKDVAKDMSISTSSVYRCRRMAKANTGKTVSASSSSSAPSPAAKPSPKKSGE